MSEPTVSPDERKQTWIGEHPNDGREYDCQCARCGSSLDFDLCEECGGDGWIEDDTDAINGPEMDVCNICVGECSFPRCLSSAEWCEANPMPGREAIFTNTPEWFLR